MEIYSIVDLSLGERKGEEITKGGFKTRFSCFIAQNDRHLLCRPVSVIGRNSLEHLLFEKIESRRAA